MKTRIRVTMPSWWDDNAVNGNEYDAEVVDDGGQWNGSYETYDYIFLPDEVEVIG